MYQSDQGDHVILKSRLKSKIVENEELFSLLGRKIYLQREYETVTKKGIYTEEEALNKALELARDKVNVKLDENEHIISQKVLKKSINDSKIYLELFVSVKEDIGMIQKIN